MNPDKLFDYLDDKLPDHERYELEQRLMREPQLQRELDVARRIHAGMRAQINTRPEVFDDVSEQMAARGRRLARQIGLAAMVLVAMNVVLGLLYIAYHERSNPNRAALENQTREQLRKALEKSAAALTPPPLGVAEIRASVTSGRVDAVGNEIVATAQRLKGTGTKGMVDNGQLQVLAELPSQFAAEFKSAISSISGVKSASGEVPATSGGDKVSIVVQLHEEK